jgi:hypothetical protein
MAVAVDAQTTASTTLNSTTSGTSALLTVGAGATALLGILCMEQATTAQTMHWDSTGTNQAMTLLGSVAGTDGWVYLFGLVNPTVGNKTLATSWTTTCFIASLDAVSFTGTDTASVAAAFQNFNSSLQTGTATTLVMTGATGNISVCASTQNAHSFTLAATGSTSLFTNSGLASAGARAPSAASLTWTATVSASSVQPMAGVDVVAAAAAVVNPSYLRPSPIQIWDH